MTSAHPIAAILGAGARPPDGLALIEAFGPPPASEHAARIDELLRVALTAGAVAVALVVAALVVAAARRRATDDDAPRRRWPQLALALVPAGFAAWLWTAGWQRHLDRATPPVRADEIAVVARAGRWEFRYPNGVGDQALHLPVGTPTRLRLSSVDTVHSLAVPALRFDQVIVPGRTTGVWVAPDRVGRYPARCGRAIGDGHPPLRTLVVVHEPGGYQAYLAARRAEIQPPAELGRAIYAERGCATCHSLDGGASTGPTFRGLVGRRETLADGTTAVVDRAYLRESILDPRARVVAGFQPVMQSYRGILGDAEIDQLIAFLEGLR